MKKIVQALEGLREEAGRLSVELPEVPSREERHPP
jgi:hypothetical protein